MKFSLQSIQIRILFKGVLLIIHYTNVLGIKFINTTFNKFIHLIEHRITNRKNTFIVTANPEIVMYANQHSNYRKLIHHANFITPDGIGIIKASQILKDPIPGRISGYDLFVNFLEWDNQNHKSVYFLGSHTKVITDLIQVVHRRFPNVKIVGFHNGYFKNVKPIVNDIRRQQPDMVFVALGYPKQEQFIYKYQTIDNALWMGIGGSFDVLSGHTERAPQFWIRHHIEWLYRLIKEPKRLGRMMSLPHFLINVYKQKMTKS